MMDMNIKIYGDFQNADQNGNIRLNTQGTQKDLALLNVVLESNMKVLISDGELEALGIVNFSDKENIWVAEIDWDMVKDVD